MYEATTQWSSDELTLVSEFFVWGYSPIQNILEMIMNYHKSHWVESSGLKCSGDMEI